MPPTNPPIAEIVVLTRAEIYTLMGEVALPPFTGHPEADTWDCAPLAQEIERVVEMRLAGRWKH